MRSREPRRTSPRRWYDTWARYLAFLTVLLTAVSTTVVFLAAKDDIGAVKDLVAVSIGILGVLVSLQLETLFRLIEKIEARDQFSQLAQGVEAHPDLTPLATKALRSSIRTLDDSTAPQLRSEVFNVLTHAVARLDDLAQGRLISEGSNNLIVHERFAHAKALIVGTTDESDLAWWTDDDGQRFLQQNRTLIAERGIVVERIWLLDRRPSKELEEMLEAHRAARVHNLIVRTDRRDLDRRLLVNMTLMDGDFLQQDRPNKQGDAVEYLYTENEADIEHARSIIGQLKSKSTEYTGPECLNRIWPDGATRSPAE